jgi:ABC-2 type transport system ATP-binding protein
MTSGDIIVMNHYKVIRNFRDLYPNFLFMHALELHNLTKTFNGFTAVNKLSLNVPKGSIYGFICPNGSGKTTTIRMIMNIFYPDSGTINILGNQSEGSKHRNIGYLPEERGLYKKMKVKELLQFYGKLRKFPNLNKEIDYWLKRFELQDRANDKIETLSKGMSQKIQFITTIIHQPEIIILDEPFSGLDPVNSELMRSVILELKEKGSTVIFSTHDMNMAELMCDYIFMIYKGEKVLDGTLHDIQSKYGSDTIRLKTDNTSTKLESLKGIEKVTDFGQYQELRIHSDADSQDILKEITKIAKVYRFELTKPSLNDIFIRIAKPTPEEVDTM